MTIRHDGATFWLIDQGHHNIFACINKLNRKSEIFILITLCAIEYLNQKCVKCLILTYISNCCFHISVVPLNDLSQQLPASRGPNFELDHCTVFSFLSFYLPCADAIFPSCFPSVRPRKRERRMRRQSKQTMRTPQPMPQPYFKFKQLYKKRLKSSVMECQCTV